MIAGGIAKRARRDCRDCFHLLPLRTDYGR
jgi:hypothetical protein